jgi:predicted enzyme related to lactoylglutathione lyase
MKMPDMTYNVVKVAGAPVGGIMHTPPPANGMPPVWCSYVTVADCDATVRKTKELGGSLVHGPEDIPNVGRFAVIKDPQGAVLNIIAYAMPQS